LNFIADAIRVSTEDGQLLVESIPRPKNGWDAAVLGTCRVGISSDAASSPYPVQCDCTGTASIKSSPTDDGKTDYWCECV
jgi:hypothetical protein